MRLYSKYRLAKSFREKGLKDYDKLCKIFNGIEMNVFNLYMDEKNKDKVSNDLTEEEEDTCKVKHQEQINTLEASGKSIMKKRGKMRQKMEKKMNMSASVDVVRCMEALNGLEGINGPMM